MYGSKNQKKERTWGRSLTFLYTYTFKLKTWRFKRTVFWRIPNRMQDT